MSTEKVKAPIEYISVCRVSEQWKIHQTKIIKLCEDGKISDAAKFDDKWIIPADAEKPYIPISTTLSKSVKANTDIQKAALENIEKGHNFHTREMVVNGRKLIVSSIFQKQGATPEEKIAGHIVRQMKKFEGLNISAADYDELMKELRSISLANFNTFEKYIKHYRMLFKEYGFSDKDIEILLERKSQDYEEFIL